MLLDIGINRLITDKAATEELLRVAIIAGDTRRRSGRRRRSLGIASQTCLMKRQRMRPTPSGGRSPSVGLVGCRWVFETAFSGC